MRSVPTYLKDLDKAFDNLCRGGYYVDVSVAFEDVIEYGIQYFNVVPQKDKVERIKERYKGLEKVYEVFRQIILAINSQMDEEWSWCDPLGDYYEYIAGRSKKSGMGQFFTPQSLCDVMAKITLPETTDRDLKINDPTCGSGRTLLAGLIHLKGKAILYAEDLDPICTKMTALNFVLHGARAEVICHNSLTPDDFRFGYRINRIKGMLPHIEVIEAYQSEIAAKARQTLSETKESVKEPKKDDPKDGAGQLQLF